VRRSLSLRPSSLTKGVAVSARPGFLAVIFAAEDAHEILQVLQVAGHAPTVVTLTHAQGNAFVLKPMDEQFHSPLAGSAPATRSTRRPLCAC